MTLYIYPKCSTCKNAMKFVENNGLKFNVKDISKTPPTMTELKEMLSLQEGNIKKLFNTSGIQYREMNLSEKLKTLSEDEALRLLSENGMLVKRPFLVTKNVGLLGFKEDQWSLKLT